MDNNEILSQAEIERRLTASANTVDVQQLIDAGIIEKKGEWYLVFNWNDLPDHVKSRITGMKTTQRKVAGQEPIVTTYVKFRAVKRKAAIY